MGVVGLGWACLVDVVPVSGVERCVAGVERAQYGQAPSVEKLLGSLPVVANFCRRLRIRELVDELCPMREVSTSVVSHGQMVEVLIANRLTSPTPLTGIELWAQEWAVGEVFGPSPEVLNDDRAGRALEAIAPVLDKITGSVGLTAIEAFGLDVTRMHWDMTSISLYGDYPQVDEEYAVPKFGHPKDRRPDLKQIQAGLAVTGDGGVPVFHRAYDGGAAEVAQVVGAMQALQKLAGPARMLIVGDSKLISYSNLATMIGEKVTFIAPASKTYVPVEVLAAQDLATATKVDYVAARDAGKPADQRGRWHVREDTMGGRPPTQLTVQPGELLAGQTGRRLRPLGPQRLDPAGAPGAAPLLGLPHTHPQSPGHVRDRLASLEPGRGLHPLPTPASAAQRESIHHPVHTSYTLKQRTADLRPGPKGLPGTANPTAVPRPARRHRAHPPRLHPRRPDRVPPHRPHPPDQHSRRPHSHAAARQRLSLPERGAGRPSEQPQARPGASHTGGDSQSAQNATPTAPVTEPVISAEMPQPAGPAAFNASASSPSVTLTPA